MTPKSPWFERLVLVASVSFSATIGACGSASNGTPSNGMSASNGGTSASNGGTSTSNGGTDSSNGGTSSSTGGRSASDGGRSASDGGTDASNGGTGGKAPGSPSDAGGGGMGPATDAGSGLQRKTRARLLLSGHSLTDTPLAMYLSHIVAAKGHDYGWEQQIAGGSPIRVRTRGNEYDATTFDGYSIGLNRSGHSKNILSELASPTSIGADESYDTLVITERNDILATFHVEGTVPYLRHYHDRLREHESATRTFFYQSWPVIDKANPQPWIAYMEKNLVAWECAASKVNLSLKTEGLPQAVTVIPAGTLLARFIKRALDGEIPGMSGSPQERLNAIIEDNVHYMPLGGYLMSAAVYAAVFGESAADVTPPADINAQAGQAAATLAWEVVSDYYAITPRPWQRSLEECATLITAMCPEYWQIHAAHGVCEQWTDPEGPLRWPDPKLPLPAP